ncbi:uncharacterized protein LOC135477638 [Liolophura sinensis]|uniref:uncharacterized protein LOC135477638 n=1 Tax=Liolophura sinensis TaxID=3198878 RepID=UPI0031590BF4
MNGMESGPKQRVNGSMLSHLQGHSVCLLGLAKNVDTNGMSFTLTTSDNMDVQVTMREPLNEYVSGLTEVHGEVVSPKGVMCSNYVVFAEDASAQFNMDLYNTAVETISKLPSHYMVTAAKSG